MSQHPPFVQIAAASGDDDTFPYIAGLDKSGQVWIYFVKQTKAVWFKASDEAEDYGDKR